MLIQFTVSNFKSFDEQTAFSMRAGKDQDLPDHVVQSGKWSAVKTAAVYGANAAGKSNLVLAMAFAQDLILRDAGTTLQKLPRFRLAGGRERASGFHWNFLYQGSLWSYGFEITSERVLEEYLFVADQNGGKERKWFERERDENGASRIQCGEAFLKSLPHDDAQLLKLNARRTPDEELFLWRFIDNQIAAIEPVQQWFNQVLTIVPAESKYPSLVPTAHDSEDFLNFLSDFLRFADAGISCLTPKRRAINPATFLTPDEPIELRNAWETRFAEMKAGESVIFMRDYVPTAIEKDEDGKIWGLELAARHYHDDGSELDFPLDWESSGTQRLVHLLAGLFGLKTQPMVLVIDEIERRFHPKLTRRFVELAQQSPIEGNQLIFTTHETALLDSLLLRRDEVFFARKKNNRTLLERLSQYPIRPGRNYEKAYDLGRIGGGPRLSFEMFGLMEENADARATEEDLVATS